MESVRTRNYAEEMRTIEKNYIPIVDNPNWNYMKVHTYYDLGGMNYFSGNVEKRGIYMSITPVQRNTSDEGYTSEVTTAYTGTKFLMQEVSRWSKLLMKYTPTNQELEASIKHVANENNITLEDLNYAVL